MFLFRNAMLLDPRFDEARGGYEVLVDSGQIREVSDRPIRAPNARVIDCGGRTLMPGLIDCHVHAYLSEVNVSLLERIPVSLLVGRAAPLMLSMLNRGFTTVRDTAGADWGIREAVEKKYLPGPLMVSGGVASPYDPLDSRQFSLPEIAAAVEEATAFKRYVLAHAYTPEAIAHLPLIMKEGFLHKNQLH